jgi:hypothetical protein
MAWWATTIETKDDIAIQTCLADIAKKHNLTTKPKDGWLIVYKPYPQLGER